MSNLSAPNSSTEQLQKVLEEFDLFDSFNQAQTIKTVLLTGGAGFIGSHTAQVLLGRGDRVVIVDEMNDYYDVRLKMNNLDLLRAEFGEAKCSIGDSNLPLLTIYRGDICDVDIMSNIFEQERPTHICHLAARAGVRASIADPYIYVHSNIEGTTRLLDLARQYSCKNFVYASSSSVYGCSANEVLNETDTVDTPVSPYAASKKACELLAYTFHHIYGLNTTGLRFFTVYGPRGRPDMAPFKFIDRISTGIEIQQYGDGSTSRDYTYISDIVDGVVRSVDRPLGYKVLNLGNGRPYKLKNFINLVEECVGTEAIIEMCPEQPGDVERTCADISSARELLGYNPQVTFEEGIAKTVQWYKELAPSGMFLPIDSAINATIVAAPVALYETSSGGKSNEEDGYTTAPGPSAGVAMTGMKKMFRHVSDLELSSYVQKAPSQITNRKERILQANILDNCLTDFLDKSKELGHHQSVRKEQFYD